MSEQRTGRSRLHPIAFIIVGGIVVLSGLTGYAYWRIFDLTEQVAHLNSQLATTAAAFTEKTENLAANLSEVDQKAAGLSDTLSQTEQIFQQRVDEVRSHVGSVEQTVGQVTGAVDTLEKLSKTDKELLQKYSKVFFLNEHYAPERVTEIPLTYLYNEASPEVVHALVYPHLKNLLDAAKSAGVTLYVKSAYRSFDEQKSLKGAYTVTYGAGTANQFSADQGYSEHQLGTAVDFITSGLGGQLTAAFDTTKAYTWMENNAYKYGFTLSYPKGNQYYVYEPWHWRYVGIKLATYLHNQGKHFYDLDQRQIDEYLVSFE